MIEAIIALMATKRAYPNRSYFLNQRYAKAFFEANVHSCQNLKEGIQLFNIIDGLRSAIELSFEEVDKHLGLFSTKFPEFWSGSAEYIADFCPQYIEWLNSQGFAPISVLLIEMRLDALQSILLTKGK